MRTQKQIEASRINGAKSRGAVTEEGKRRARRHNLRHGILAATTVLEEESLAVFNDLADSYFDAAQPRDPIERSLVETMISARWRLNRVRSIAKTAMDRDMAMQDDSVAAPVRAVFAIAGAPSSSDGSCRPDLLLRYEASLEHAYHAALRRLTSLRKGKPTFAHAGVPFEPSDAADIWRKPTAPEIGDNADDESALEVASERMADTEEADAPASDLTCERTEIDYATTV